MKVEIKKRIVKRKAATFIVEGSNRKLYKKKVSERVSIFENPFSEKQHISKTPLKSLQRDFIKGHDVFVDDKDEAVPCHQFRSLKIQNITEKDIVVLEITKRSIFGAKKELRILDNIKEVEA